MTVCTTDLSLPFFSDEHRALTDQLTHWTKSLPATPPTDIDQECRYWVKTLGAAGWLRYCVPDMTESAPAASTRAYSARSLCLVRETLARHCTLADFAFAMQGLGAGCLSLFGNIEQRSRYLPGVATGQLIPAFALSETQAGSDVAALGCLASRLDNGNWQLDGEKNWISNAGIADYYIVFARTKPKLTRSSQGISAFIVDKQTQGFTLVERQALLSPHPIGRLRFDHCQIPDCQRIGQPENGFKMAMATLDLFRISVAAAALGLAQRALAASLAHVQERQLFGQRLADMQLTQVRIADMSTQLEAASLLTYRAAWLRDQGQATTRAAAMAKLQATETAQKIIDQAVQLFGARGVSEDEPLAALYRDIRALRIYEGASEIQQLIIARETYKCWNDERNP